MPVWLSPWKLILKTPGPKTSVIIVKNEISHNSIKFVKIRYALLQRIKPMSGVTQIDFGLEVPNVPPREVFVLGCSSGFGFGAACTFDASLW